MRAPVLTKSLGGKDLLFFTRTQSVVEARACRIASCPPWNSAFGFNPKRKFRTSDKPDFIRFVLKRQCWKISPLYDLQFLDWNVLTKMCFNLFLINPTTILFVFNWFFFSYWLIRMWKKKSQITWSDKPVKKPCCRGSPNGEPPIAVSRIRSLKLQKQTPFFRCVFKSHAREMLQIDAKKTACFGAI